MSCYDRFGVYIDGYVKNGIICIDKKEFKKFKRGLSEKYKERIICEVTTWIESGDIHYPTLDMMVDNDDVVASFKLLKTIKKKVIKPKNFRIEGVDPNRLLFKKQYYVILISNLECEITYISDYFQDAAKSNYPGVALKNYWLKNAKDIVESCVEEHKSITTETLRYHLHKNKRIPSSNIMVARSIMQIFKSKRVLDPFAGWGNNLLAALSLPIISYQGINPNHEVFKGYGDMCQFNREPFRKPMSVSMLCGPFDDIEISEMDTCDLVLACPTTTNTKYIITCLTKSWELLDNGGHLVLDIDIKIKPKLLLKCIDEFKNSIYRGCIGYAEDLSTTGVKRFSQPKPLFVWKKTY